MILGGRHLVSKAAAHVSQAGTSRTARAAPQLKLALIACSNKRIEGLCTCSVPALRRWLDRLTHDAGDCGRHCTLVDGNGHRWRRWRGRAEAKAWQRLHGRRRRWRPRPVGVCDTRGRRWRRGGERRCRRRWRGAEGRVEEVPQCMCELCLSLLDRPRAAKPLELHTQRLPVPEPSTTDGLEGSR